MEDKDFIAMGFGIYPRTRKPHSHVKDNLTLSRVDNQDRHLKTGAPIIWTLRISAVAYRSWGEPSVFGFAIDKSTNRIRFLPDVVSFSINPKRRGGPSVGGSTFRELPVGRYDAVGDNIYEYAGGKDDSVDNSSDEG